MKLDSKWMDWLITAVLPLAFFGSGFLNILAFPFGLHDYDTVRTLITFGILGGAALFLFCRAAALYVKKSETRRPIRFASLILALFGLVYLWALLIQKNKTFILKEAVVQGCYLLSAWSALILIALEKRLRSFLRACRIYSLILSPIIIFYCVRLYLPGADYYARDLGTVDYMSLAYTLLTACVLLFLEVMLYDGEPGSPAPFFYVNLCLILLFSVAIALSGTKGTILCLAFFSVLFILYRLCLRKKTAPRRWYSLPISACLALLLFSVLLFPVLDVNNRIVGFLHELTDQQFAVTEETTQKALEVMEKIRGESSSPITYDDIAGVLTDKTVKEYLESGAISQEEYDALEALSRSVNNTATGGRMYLWQSAVREIKSAPLAGQGPFFFQSKHGTYPHNFFLELATDFGLILTLAVLFFGIFVFVRLIRFSLFKPVYMAFLLYVLAFLPQHMVSGSAYGNSVFFQYGFCILAVFLPKSAFVAENAEDA